MAFFSDHQDSKSRRSITIRQAAVMHPNQVQKLAFFSGGQCDSVWLEPVVSFSAGPPARAAIHCSGLSQPWTSRGHRLGLGGGCTFRSRLILLHGRFPRGPCPQPTPANCFLNLCIRRCCASNYCHLLRMLARRVSQVPAFPQYLASMQLSLSLYFRLLHPPSCQCQPNVD